MMHLSIDAVDAHAGGQHGRVILGGVGRLAVHGATMFERMRSFQQQHDWFRELMLYEPRGYPQSCVNVVVPPADASADAGVIVMVPKPEYPSMSGTNTMCVTTVLLETGILPMSEPITELVLDFPGGLVHVQATCEAGRVTEVRFRNVSSFVTELDVPLEVPGIGTVEVDLAYGGMAYVLADTTRLGVRLTPETSAEVREVGVAIGGAARAQLRFQHPQLPQLSTIDGTVLYGPGQVPGADLRMTAVLTSGMMDRTPSGTGLSARLAALHARGVLEVGDHLRAEGIVGAVWEGGIVETGTVGDRPAVVPEVAGQAWITSYARYVLQEDDPFPTGFRMGDLWHLE